MKTQKNAIMKRLFLAFLLLAAIWLVSNHIVSKEKNSTKKSFTKDHTSHASHYHVEKTEVYFHTYQPRALGGTWNKGYIDDATEETFVELSDRIGINTSDSKSLAYFGTRTISGIESPEKLVKAVDENQFYFTDGEYLYYITRRYFYEKNNKIKKQNFENLSKVDVSNFDYPEILLRMGDRIILKGIEIQGVHADSFEFLYHDDSADTNLAENDMSWFFDKNHVYMNGHMVIGADPESIRIPEQDKNLNAEVAVDDEYVYSSIQYDVFDKECRSVYCPVDLRINNLESKGFTIPEGSYIRGYKSDRYITDEGIFDGEGGLIQ